VVAQLTEDIVNYDIEIYDEDLELVKSIIDNNIVCTLTSCIINIIIEDPATDFMRFDYDDCSGISDLTCSLTFSSTLNTTTLNWIDNTGDSATFRLFVERLAINGTSIVCNNASTSTSGTIVCSLGSSINSYRIQGFRKVGTREYRINILNVNIGDEIEVFGLEGFMWAFLLLFTLVMFGLWSPVVGIILYLAGMLILGVTQIVYISYDIMIAEMIIGILAIWALKQ
jgi:hypothetical protein